MQIDPVEHLPASTGEAVMKVSLAWLGAMWGSITLQTVVLALTAFYTALQIYILLRDKIAKKGMP